MISRGEESYTIGMIAAAFYGMHNVEVWLEFVLLVDNGFHLKTECFHCVFNIKYWPKSNGVNKSFCFQL